MDVRCGMVLDRPRHILKVRERTEWGIRNGMAGERGEELRAEFGMRLATTYKTFTKIFVSWLFCSRHRKPSAPPHAHIPSRRVIIEIVPIPPT